MSLEDHVESIENMYITDVERYAMVHAVTEQQSLSRVFCAIAWHHED